MLMRQNVNNDFSKDPPITFSVVQAKLQTIWHGLQTNVALLVPKVLNVAML